MANTEPEHMIEVSESWMTQVAHLANRVRKQVEQLPDEDIAAFNKTDVALLVAYTASAANIIKYRRIADRENGND